MSVCIYSIRLKSSVLQSFVPYSLDVAVLPAHGEFCISSDHPRPWSRHHQPDGVGNVLGMSRCESAEKVRQDIRGFRAALGLGRVEFFWTASTERFTEIQENLHLLTTKPSFRYFKSALTSTVFRRTPSLLASSISSRSTTWSSVVMASALARPR